jgi:hypothetical protein
MKNLLSHIILVDPFLKWFGILAGFITPLREHIIFSFLLALSYPNSCLSEMKSTAVFVGDRRK